MIKLAASDAEPRDTVVVVRTCRAAQHTEVRNWKINSEEGFSMTLRNIRTT